MQFVDYVTLEFCLLFYVVKIRIISNSQRDF